MMAYKGYLAHITFDAQANLFHGEVVNIRDVVTFQGQSVDELRQALADSVEDYLALALIGFRGLMLQPCPRSVTHFSGH